MSTLRLASVLAALFQGQRSFQRVGVDRCALTFPGWRQYVPPSCEGNVLSARWGPNVHGKALTPMEQEVRRSPEACPIPYTMIYLLLAG
jgi:hypothetical protein